MFWKRRAVQLTFVNPDKPGHATVDDGGPTFDHILVENVARYGKDFVTHTAAAVIVTYSAVKVVDTVCKIAVVVAKAKVK